MRKFIFTTFLMVCLHCSSANLIWIGDLQYAFQGNSAAVVDGHDYDDNYVNGNLYAHYSNESYNIPSEVVYDGRTFVVDKIGNGCFDDGNINHPYSKKIKKITLPETIKYIGGSAFGGTNISSIIIPKSVLSFGGTTGAFSDNDFLAVIIYTGETPPANWTATTTTYVPDKVAYSSPSFSINGASIVEMISFSNTTFEYTGQAPSTTWTNNVEGYNASLSMPVLKKDVGSYEEIIPVTFTKGDESFTANVVYRYTIKPIELTATVTSISRQYGEDNPQFSITYTGFLSGDDESAITTMPTASTTATKASNVGEYPITLSGGMASYYEFVYEPGVLTVTKAPLTAKVKDAAKVYGANNPTFAIEYSGLKNNESAPAWSTSPSFQTSATKSSGVGQYTVKAINGVPRNYELGEITPGTLTITPAPLTIIASDKTRQYYSDNPSFSYTCSGFVNGDNSSTLSPAPTLTTTANLSSNVGTYEIIVSNANNPNYSISYTNGTLTITPRTLTASVGNYERNYNEENPTFEVNYEGFVGNDGIGVLSSNATASTTATKTSNVGTYPITVSGGSAVNYNFSYSSGILKINKAEQTISWEQNLEGLHVGDQVELLAAASSGLPITYTMDNYDAAEIYSAGTKTYLDCKAGGQFSIRAMQNGNNNYYSSPRISNNVSISGSNPSSDPVLTIKQADNGSVSTQVSKGSVYTFTINTSTGWKIHSVTYNNTDVTSQLSSDNTFTTPTINSSSTLSIVYEEDNNTAVKSIRESSVKIHAMSFGIRVTDANIEDLIQVYSVDGILLKSSKPEGQTTDILLPNGNVYIVKVGTKTMKLSI